jgi:hypothetical protein
LPPVNWQRKENVDAIALENDHIFFLGGLVFVIVLSFFTGIWWSLFITWALRKLRVLATEKLLRLEALTCMDYFFLYDDYKNRANIIACGVYERFSAEKVRKQFKEKAFRFPRLKQRLVRVVGEYYWQTIPEQEFLKMADSLIIDLKDEDIHTEEQLAEYVSRESQVKEVLDRPQWRLYLKEDY